MERDITNFFYAGIAYGACEKALRKIRKEGLPIRKLEKEFPYLWGEGRGRKGIVQIYYALLPEYRRKSKFGGVPKPWKSEKARLLLEQAGEKAVMTLNCQEQLSAYAFNQNPGQIPNQLMAVCLYRQRPFDKLCISLPLDGSEYHMQQAVELLSPDLTRMRQVVLTGADSEASELLEEYLYEEFGIIMVKDSAPPRGMPWLDLSGREEDHVERSRRAEAARRISAAEALKFLDTAVKNGYNTEVN